MRQSAVRRNRCEGLCDKVGMPIMIRNDQRNRGRTDWWIINGGKTHRHRRRRLNSPLYSASDVPWMRNGGNGGNISEQMSEGPPLSIIPDSLPTHTSASPSPFSSVVSPSPDKEGSDENELMQVAGASGGTVQRDDSGVSGSYVSACPVLTYVPATTGSTGGTGGDDDDGMTVVAMAEEEMESGREATKWRECGREVVFDPHTNCWIGGRGSGDGGVGTIRQTPSDAGEGLGGAAAGGVTGRMDDVAGTCDDSTGRVIGGWTVSGDSTGAMIGSSGVLGRIGVGTVGDGSTGAVIGCYSSVEMSTVSGTEAAEM